MRQKHSTTRVNLHEHLGGPSTAEVLTFISPLDVATVAVDVATSDRMGSPPFCREAWT